jgi:hypothetical protein
MVTTVSRRWGIFSIAILMCLTTLLFGGGKGSIYVVFWGYAAYLGYKGDIDTLAGYLKIVIVLNVIVLSGILLLVDAEADLWRWTGWGNSGILALAVAIPLSVMVGMFAYIRGQLRSSEQLTPVGAGAIGTTPAQSSDPPSPQTPAGVIMQQPPTMEDAYTSISAKYEAPPFVETVLPTGAYSMEDAYAASLPDLPQTAINARTERHIGADTSSERAMAASGPSGISTTDVEALWASALDEFEGPLRRKGLWAKLYAELDGNEVNVRVAYLKTRFAQLQKERADLIRADEVRRTTEKQQHLRTLSARDCYGKGLYSEVKAEGYDCLHFHNGQAAIRFRDKLKVYASPDALRRRIAELAQPPQPNATASIDEFSV